MSKVVLITGCSSGIGRDLAQRLKQSGYLVVATARDITSLVALNADLKLPLDVTQPDSARKAVNTTIQYFGRVDVLVNNAGFAQYGAIEELSDEQVQCMFNINIYGVLRMVRAVAPHMRSRKSGRIVNIGSIAGKLTTPVNGIYSATKAALEATSDALRWEMAPFGIQVSLVEPGAIKTHFDQNVRNHAQEILSNPHSPYQALYRQYQLMSDSMRQQEPGPEAVSKVVQLAIESDRPKARYLVAFPFPGSLVLRLGSPVWDFIARRMYQI